MSFNEVLKQLQSNNITDTAKEQGTLFEKLIKKILQTSPLFTTRFKEVYLWNEFSAKYNLKSQDIGIDIMAITHDNEYVSIQCKCFDSKHILQQNDLKNFLGIDRLFDAHNNFICDIAEKLIFHTCEIESSNYQKAITQSTNAKSYSYYHLAQELGINWNSLNHKNIESSIENLSLEGKKSLRDYQKQALEAIKHTFLEQNKPRAKVIMACGTGKSLLSIRAIDSIIQKGEICVFFAPSLALINQMLKDFFKESSGDYRVFAVCSDSKVGLKVSGGGGK